MAIRKREEDTPVNLPVNYKPLEELARALVRQLESIQAESARRPPAPGGGEGIDLEAAVRSYETDLILWALNRTGGHQRRAAELLGLKVTTLNAKIRRYRIRPQDFKLSDG